MGRAIHRALHAEASGESFHLGNIFRSRCQHCVAEAKIKKETQGDTLTLTLVKNPDILRDLVLARKAGQVIVGFAAETETDPEALLALSRAKIARKGCDYLVVNRVGWTTGFATDGNAVTILAATGVIVGEASGSKSSVADRILDVLL